MRCLDSLGIFSGRCVASSATTSIAVQLETPGATVPMKDQTHIFATMCWVKR
jgi:hypothetical protein